MCPRPGRILGRGAGGQDSDVDLVVLTTDTNRLLGSSDWYAAFGERVELIRTSDFGAIQEASPETSRRTGRRGCCRLGA
jgi:hypothetical protein